jgi:uncharacterized delta-60 repeat protein
MTGSCRPIRLRLLAIALATALATGLAIGARVPAAQAAPGDLDTGFGTGGTARLAFPLPQALSTLLHRGLRIDSAGKILTSRFSGSATDNLASVARLLPDGTPDPAFGTNGYATVDLSVPGLASRTGDFTLLPGGKVLVFASAALPGQWPNALALVRLMPDGTPDTDFGPNGKVVVQLPAHGVGVAEDVVAVPDGHLYILQNLTDTLSSGFRVARITPAGALDTTFGTQGILSIRFGSSGLMAHSMDLTPDGKILAVGRLNNPMGWDYGLARLLPDGRLDPSFGNGGTAAADGLGHDFPVDRHAFLPDGSVFVGGVSTLTRIHDNGIVDRSFFDGKFTQSPLEAFAPASTVTPTGRLVGVLGTGSARRIARLNLATGRYDPTFGSFPNAGGIPIAATDGINIVATGGKIVTLGIDQNGPFLRRYLNDAPAVAPLRVSAACPPGNPNLTWRVANPNGEPLRFSWRIAGTGQRGGGVAASNGQVAFSSIRVVGPNRVELLVDGLVVGSAEACKVVVRPRP